MYEVYAKQAIEWWKAQIGKKCGKMNEYSAYMDGYKFYNYPKNGISDSCAIFYDTAIMKTMSPEANANAARAILCEPNVDNCGAGCVFKVDYYKKAGRWIPGTNPSAAQSGDEIFFYKDSYKKKENPYGVYHTGTIVNWDNKGFYVVEGNTNGGMVAQKFYAYNNPLILGFGRPKWTGWLPDPEPTPEPTPTPTPEPVPEDNKYKVVNIKQRILLAAFTVIYSLGIKSLCRKHKFKRIRQCTLVLNNKYFQVDHPSYHICYYNTSFC